MEISSNGTYYGERKNELRQNGFILSEYDYLEPSTPWHFHENPYFMYVLKGNMFDINKKNKVGCPAGSLVFHNWQEPHLNTKASSAARGFHIEFDRNWFAQRRLDIGLWEGSQLIQTPRLHHILAQLYYEFRNNDTASALSIELLLLQLCEGLDRRYKVNTRTNPRWISDLKSLLNEDLDNVSLDNLSSTLGIHPVHLSRSFPKYFSSTLGDYIRQLKVKKALSLLLIEEYSLTEVAFLAGFADQSHFIRCFKRYMGVTPLKFKTKNA